MELGKVADDVWEKGVKEKGLHSKLLDLVGKCLLLVLSCDR